jgi:DNA-binding transcriptional ArsR family regulator
MLPAVTELDAAGETPAYSSDVREICKRRVGDVDAESLWSVTRRDVTRALAALADAGLVEARVERVAHRDGSTGVQSRRFREDEFKAYPDANAAQGESCRPTCESQGEGYG